MKSEIAALCAAVTLAAAMSAVAYEVSPGTKIVVPDKDTTGISSALKVAASELRADIEEATGWKLSVVEASKAGDTAGAIMIGEKFAAEAGLVPPDLRFFDNVIAEKGGRLYLFGHDRPCKNAPRLPWAQCIMASVKAVTDFEYKYMGVKRIQPGRTGMEIPKLAKISVPDGVNRISRPHMENGMGHYFGMMYSIANNLLGYGTYCTYGGHTYNVAFPPEKYRESHPEYYGLVAGERSKRKVNAPLCITNPEVKRLLVEHILGEFDKGADVVELGQQDSHEFCECGNCQAYGGPGAKTIGEKYWIFHRSIAEELYKLRPEKTVQIIAYMDTDCTPKTFREFPPNVMVELMTFSEDVFREWSGYVVPRGFSVYIYISGDYQGPGMTCKANTRVFARLARRFVKNNVRSIYRCGYPGQFGCEGPATYVFNMLLADPDLDEDALFDEYVDTAYGPAAEHMRKFHRAYEERVAAWSFCFNDNRKWPWQRERSSHNTITAIYTSEMLAQCGASLADAEKTPGLSEKAKRRLQLVRREFDYARLTAETCMLYDAYKIAPSRDLFEEIASRVAERRALVDSFFDESGKVKPIEGWPDYVPLGKRISKQLVLDNGRLFAPLREPFNWDFDKMRKSFGAKGPKPAGRGKNGSESVRDIEF